MDYRNITSPKGEKKVVINKGDGVYFSLTNKQLDELESLINELQYKRRIQDGRLYNTGEPP